MLNRSKHPAMRVNWLELGVQFGLIIALPLISFLLLGLWLDRRLGTLPLFLFIGIVLASILSAVALKKLIKKITSEMNHPS